MQQKTQGLLELSAPSFQDQLRESLGIGEDGATLDNMDMKDEEASSGDIHLDRLIESLPDDAPLSLHQDPPFLLQARPVDKFRNDRNIRFGPGGYNTQPNKANSSLTQPSTHAMVAPSALLSSLEGSENAHQKTSVALHAKANQASFVSDHRKSEGVKN